MSLLEPIPTPHSLAILQALPDPLFILTRSGRYAALYGGTDTRYYHDGGHLVGRNIRDVLEQEKADWFIGAIGRALESRRMHVVEYTLSASDVKGLVTEGPIEPIWFEGRIRALGFPVDGEEAVLWVASNISERKVLEDQLRERSERDGLSGLFNRAKLQEMLEERFGLYARYGESTAIMLFDIDCFKRINDSYGHHSGDAAILAVASVCREQLRSTDVAARIGGDEFVILMPHTTCAQALPFADRLRNAVHDSLAGLGTMGEGATISGGLTELMVKDKDGEDALRRADGAMYAAKRDGRNRIVVG